MKLSGVLAIMLALILGGWAATDYYANTRKQSELVQAQSRDIDRSYHGGSVNNPTTDRMADELQSGYRDDAMAGIGAAVCLIAGIVFYTKR